MRLHPDDRKDQILQAAVLLAAKPGGWSTLTRSCVAKQANCSDALISSYFGTMANFKRDISRAAVRTTNLWIIAQALAAGEPWAIKLAPGLKSQALKTIGG